jgi:hypothetical protein
VEDKIPVVMPVGALCFDLMLFYFASKARVRTFISYKIYPKFFFWRASDKEGAAALSPRPIAAWAHRLGRVGRSARVFKFPHVGERTKSVVENFSVIQDAEIDEGTRGDHQQTGNGAKSKTTEHAAQSILRSNVDLNRPAPFFIRVQSLPLVISESSLNSPMQRTNSQI